jgi:hypothetical protein
MGKQNEGRKEGRKEEEEGLRNQWATQKKDTHLPNEHTHDIKKWYDVRKKWSSESAKAITITTSSCAFCDEDFVLWGWKWGGEPLGCMHHKHHHVHDHDHGDD